MVYNKEGRIKMKKFLNFIFVITIIALVFSGCEDKTNLTAPGTPNPVNGSADLTRFVTIGNSLTAGYQSGALYKSAQEYSYGNLIAQQVGTTFEQPLVSDPGVGGRMEIKSVDFATNQINIVYEGSTGIPLNLNYAAPYNNLGVPGALLYDVLNATDSTNCASGLVGSPNPLFNLILRGIGTQFEEAKMLHPTFVTLWIGNNDVLGYATSGGVSPSAPTPVSTFQYLYSLVADSLASLGANVVVANIPNVTAIPFFTTVGPLMAQALSQAGVSGIYYQKSDGSTTNIATTSDLLTGKVLITLPGMTYASLIGHPTGQFYRDHGYPALPPGIDTTKPFGVTPNNPWPNALILDPDEITTALNTTADFNTAIAQLASQKNFGLVDINSFFDKIREGDFKGGTMINGVKFYTSYITGGLFGLDGVHPTDQGQAIIANEFIKEINSKFNASIPLINVATIPGSIILAKKSFYHGIQLPHFEPGSFNHLLY